MVHLAGGSAGLIATILIGARIDRFSPSKGDDFKPNNIVTFLSHNYKDLLRSGIPYSLVRLVRLQLRVHFRNNGKKLHPHPTNRDQHLT